MGSNSNNDNSGNSNGRGHMQQSIKRAAEETTAAAMVTGSSNDCDNGKEGSGNNGERAG